MKELNKQNLILEVENSELKLKEREQKRMMTQMMQTTTTITTETEQPEQEEQEEQEKQEKQNEEKKKQCFIFFFFTNDITKRCIATIKLFKERNVKKRT